jgi:hypothetical protein
MNTRHGRTTAALVLIAALTGCSSAEDEPKADASRATTSEAGEHGHSDGDKTGAGLHAREAAPAAQAGDAIGLTFGGTLPAADAPPRHARDCI